MGEEDYDEYSKELNQYRRSKDGRGRGGQGPRWRRPKGHLPVAAGFGSWREAVGECHLCPLQA